MSPEQLRARVASDEAMLKAISGLEADAKVTASNASRAVHEAQKALLAAHAWLASALATYESYRLEHLRLTEVVARSRTLLHMAAVSLPDELVIQIAQLCVEDAREPLVNGRMVLGDGTGDREGQPWNVGWVYPMALSQVCRRWRSAILGCLRLWAYKDNLAPGLSPALAELINLRSGSCTLDAVWNGSLPVSPESAPPLSMDRWRSLKVLIPSPSSEPYPLNFTASCNSLSSLSITASHKLRAPTFASSLLSQMPALTTLELTDVHFIAPPPYRHNSLIDISIRYNGVTPFREKDMADIAIVFPKLRKFSLYIRGPYINKPTHGLHATTGVDRDHHNGLSNSVDPSDPLMQPFSFPELIAMDVSAKDLSHSLARFNGAFVPKLAYLRLRDNGLPVATTFFQHLVRSRVPLSTLSLTDFSPIASGLFRGYKNITALEFELSSAAVEALRPLDNGPPQLPPIPGVSPTTTTFPTPPSVSFAYVSTITLLPPSLATTGGSVSKHEERALRLLAEVIRQRTEVILRASGETVLREKALPDPPVEELSSDDGVGKEREKGKKGDQPMTSADTLVDLEPAGTMNSAVGDQTHRVFGHTRVWSGERARRMTVSGSSMLGMVPIMDVKYTPLRARGRTAMEEVYGALTDSRRTWGRLIERKFGTE